ncbi:MAG TPA: hypothetical protein ENN03_10640 [bacterium]|nr:hypothetical protein [bacterium]
MNLFQWVDEKVKNQTVWDIGVLKLFCVIIGMILGACWFEFVFRHQMWFIIAAIVLFVILMIRFFTGKKKAG